MRFKVVASSFAFIARVTMLYNSLFLIPPVNNLLNDFLKIF